MTPFQHSDALISELQVLLNDLQYEEHSINCAEMVSFEEFHNCTDRHKHYLGEMFKKLDAIKKHHVVYWFEADSPENAKTCLSALDKYRESTAPRCLPAPNKVNSQDSNNHTKVLYVGKKEAGSQANFQMSHISGRIITHLGYNHKSGAPGLQIFHWGAGKEIALTLCVAKFPQKIMNDSIATKEYLGAIEKLFAIKLRPLCGQRWG